MPLRVAACAREVMVVDPAVATPELDCFNVIARLSPLPCSYHLPALRGMESLRSGALAAPPAAIMILGSRASVHDPLPWQEELRRWLGPFLAAGVPVMGFCYGHQLLAHFFGAQVAFHKSGEKLVGMRQITILPQSRLAMGQPSTGPLVVSHREEVLAPPACFEPFAISSAGICEGLAHRTLPVWTLQAHPEATLQFCRNQALEPEPSSAAFEFGWSLLARFLAFSKTLDLLGK